MRLVFVTPSSPGFVGPTALLARALAQRGHEVLVLAARSTHAQLARHGLPVTDGGAGERNFHTPRWAEISTNLALSAALRNVIGAGADAIVAHHLTLAAYAVGDVLGLPVAIIGHAAWLWPTREDGPTEQRTGISAADRTCRLREFLRYLNRIRTLLRLPALGDGLLPTGDLHLLRTIPELEPAHAALPAQVHLVGPLLSPSPTRLDPDLATWLAAEPMKPLCYVQQGPTHGKIDAMEHWRLIAAAGWRAVIDPDRASYGPWPDWTSPGAPLFVRQNLAMEQVLPHARAAIVTGHPTGVLGCLQHGRPMVVMPNGSGTEVLANQCVDLGVAVALPPTDEGAAGIPAALARLATDEGMHQRAAVLGQKLSLGDPAERSADLIELMVEERRARVVHSGVPAPRFVAGSAAT